MKHWILQKDNTSKYLHDIFMDILNLTDGERWESEWLNYIESNDELCRIGQYIKSQCQTIQPQESGLQEEWI